MSLSVLLVDDDPARAAIVEPALRAAGYDVVTVVDTATEMLAQVRAQHEALDAMQRQLDDVLRTVEATRASWPGSGREAG